MSAQRTGGLLISAAICTYNRAELLGHAIESLCQQSLRPSEYEIIVVDNASTDRTPAVVHEFRARYLTHDIRLIGEATPGLGHARNAAWQNAQSEFIAYIDDDARADPQWLEQLVTCFATLQPTPMCVGGPVQPFYSVAKPDWFTDSYETITLGDESRFLAPHEVLAGGNMAWSRTALKAFGGFDIDKGVQGDTLSLGEETWLFHRIRAQVADPAFYYSASARIKHLVAPNKLRLAYQLKRLFVAGQLDARDHVVTRAMTRRNRLGTALVKSGRAANKVARAAGQFRRFPYWQNWVLGALAPVFIDFGYVMGMLGVFPTIKQREP